MPATAPPTTPRRTGGASGPRSYAKRTSPQRPGRSGGMFAGKGRGNAGNHGEASGKPTTDDHEILFQKFFKSVGPRTYAAQLKRATNGNHYLVLMEGKRDEETGEVRKTRLFVYSEDFVEFFRLVKSTAEFIKANPVPEDVRRKREKFWQKQQAQGVAAGPAAPRVPVVSPAAAPAARPA